MNINDVKDTDIQIPKNIWKEIFKNQHELALKYRDIEGMGTLLETTSTNLDTKIGQKWIKDFAWRVTEELAEAQEAFDLSESKNLDSDEYMHYLEELIDALHFMVELSIIAGYDETIITPVYRAGVEIWDIVYHLGLACNCLKNKPWKQTQLLTDRKKFETHLERAWHTFISIFGSIGFDDKDIYLFYAKKRMVNQFRIRSKY